jgi:hypothetical protein
MTELVNLQCVRQMANHASNHTGSALYQLGPFVAEKLCGFRFSKWVGTANAIGWRVGSFLWVH